MPYRILTLNNISARGLERLPAARFTVAADLDQPDGILVRSADMHRWQFPHRCSPSAARGPDQQHSGG